MYFPNKKPILFLILAIIVTVAGFYVLQNNQIFTGRAESDDNIIGYAWSENMGWISFNCTNESNCASSNYGVDVDMLTGEFSGYAWSSNIGWIDFSPSGPYPGAPYHGVKYEYGDSGSERRVTGWAKTLVLEDEGWIKLNSDPWLSGWDQRRQITIDSNDINNDLDQFPVPVSINNNAGKNNADITSIFDEVGTSSQKIAITESDGVTQLYAEIEKWDAASEEAVIWAGGYNCDIDSSSNTHFYIYYDNDQSSNDSYVTLGTNATTSEQIWGNDYSLVQHLNEEEAGTGTAALYKDSTDNNNDGDDQVSATSQDGQINGGQEFDGDDDYVRDSNPSGLNFSGLNEITIEAWFKLSGHTDYDGIVSINSSSTYRTMVNTGQDQLRYDPGQYDDQVIDQAWSTGEWYHYIMTVQGGGNAKIYWNGDNIHTSATGVPAILPDGSDILIGIGEDPNSHPTQGIIDEVRISNIARSPAWVETDYRAGMDDLLTWGSEEFVDYGVTADIKSGEFSGWAWNKSRVNNVSGIGWISFNCADSGAGGCTSTDYMVSGNLNTVPTSTNMTSPNWGRSDACPDTALQSILEWEFSDPDKGSSQSAYQLVVDTDDTIDNHLLLDTEKTSGNAQQYLLNSSFLDYNTSYYWWIKVWDNRNIASDWHQYSTEPDTDNDDGNANTFTTYKHEFPEVYFHWVPDPPSVNEDVTFTSDSLRYTVATPTIATTCSSSTCQYAWDFSGSDATITEGSTSSSTITVQFTSSSTQTVVLEVADQDDYTCASSTSFEMNPELPIWREVKVND